MKKQQYHTLFSVILTIIASIFLSVTVLAKSEKVIVFSNVNSPQINFAIENLKSSLSKKSIEFQLLTLDKWDSDNENRKIVFAKISDKDAIKVMRKSGVKVDEIIESEGFVIRVSQSESSTIWIIAVDDAGLMYGGFEVAELLETGGFESVQNQSQNPYMKMRGTKFNIPLDVRTPSYSDVCDAAQNNMLEMWSFDFWKEYIDSLARYRYNYISLWSMHPFPSLVKVPEYPDVALDDVRQSTVDWLENYSLNGHLFKNPEIFENTKVIKKITIDEKIEFWKKVMRYGKERNVDFYFVTWNIFTYGVDGKYGIDDDINNQTTRDYFRQSVKQMFLTYPDLAGIGLTTGENMYGHSTELKEEWAFETYGQGVLDAAKELPDRKITLIHRQHQAGAREIAKKFQPLVDHQNINFIFSFKYAQAHVYSSINQPFHKSFVNDIQQDGNLKTIWTLRNDDVFYFRWGAPDFVREFIKGIPYEISDGYYYGSDQYVWGREFLTKNVEGMRQIELAKHWYHWMMWGRLGYNPNMENERFEKILKARYPKTDGAGMFTAWQNASMIYPLVTGFHWGSLDFQWYIEANQSRPFYAQTPSGFNDLNFFIELPPHPGTDNISITDFVNAKLKEKTLVGTSPFEVADKILKNADAALNWTKTAKVSNAEMEVTVNDIKSMAYLGKYYAHKIKAATNLQLFRKTLDGKFQTALLNEIRQSALYWRYYASNSLAVYKNPLWTNRVGIVDWRETYRHVCYEISVNGGDLNIPSMETTSGGTILEAEDAEFEITKFNSKIKGFTGKGYLESNAGDATIFIKWTFEAPEDGMYSLEFRYSSKRQQHFNSQIKINDKVAGEIVFWESGQPESWVWDRCDVFMKKGENTIEVAPEGFVIFDHLNVIKKSDKNE